MGELRVCPLLQNASNYQPDMLDLNKDSQAAEYWFPCFRNMIAKFAAQAAASQSETDASAAERAVQFQMAYLQKLDEYQSQLAENAKNGVRLGTRELLELNEVLLRRFSFPDPWLRQKQTENASAVKLLSKRLRQIDDIENENKRWTELVRGMLAGNMFDWGAQAVTQILDNDKGFGLQESLERIEQRPWLLDDLDAWLERMHGAAHKCAVIFVDNSGIDVVLGVLPFARELLKRGTKVLLCANEAPSLNDVTSAELQHIISLIATQCILLDMAVATKRLLVYSNGHTGPCLDMRHLPLELCEAMQTYGADLFVLEGMGRALHTNLCAKFSCESLKLAVIKNQWLARRLGGEVFAVMCKYENNSSGSSSGSDSSRSGDSSTNGGSSSRSDGSSGSSGS